MSYTQRQDALRKREARIRYQMLNVIHGSRTNRHAGWITGRGVVEAMAWCGPDHKPDDDTHAMGLLADLVLHHHIEIEDNREDKSQAYGLDHLTYRVTAKGTGYINRTEPAHAMIDDGRIIK